MLKTLLTALAVCTAVPAVAATPALAPAAREEFPVPVGFAGA